MKNGSSSFLCRDRNLYFSVFFFLSLLRLFFYFWTIMVLSGVTRRNGGGDGGGFADRSRWFFLSSVSLLVSAFSVFSLSLHPQNSPVRSSLHTKNSPLFLSFSLPKNPPDSIVCFSLSPKFSPFVFCSVFIGNLGRGSPYPVQAQGMVVGARVF